MALTAGAQFGSFEIIASLGAGGVGEVYQARDRKLGRYVAIKILRSELAQTPERLARFEREARLLALINHPNIATVYSLEEAEEVRFLVMELVPGKTLAERLTEGRLAPKAALSLFSQIADGLSAAHANGVIHRDLKPGNVKVTPEGTVKVLDFGLGKAVAVEADPSGPTGSLELTQEGMILGTPAYMSPEQVRGETLDGRTDIWSLGCILYEMLSGRQAFPVHSIVDLVAVILEREPDWTALPKAVPAGTEELVRCCLQKDRDRRPSSIAEVRRKIREPAHGPETAAVSDNPTLPVPRTVELTSGVALSATQPVAERSGLDKVRTSVFITHLARLRELHKKEPRFPNIDRFCLAIGALCLVATPLLPLSSSIVGSGQKDAYAAGALGALVVGILMCGLGIWAGRRLGRRGKQRSIDTEIDLIDQQCPGEVERWGGNAMLRSLAGVEGILQMLGSAANLVEVPAVPDRPMLPNPRPAEIAGDGASIRTQSPIESTELEQLRAGLFITQLTGLRRLYQSEGPLLANTYLLICLAVTASCLVVIWTGQWHIPPYFLNVDMGREILIGRYIAGSLTGIFILWGGRRLGRKARQRSINTKMDLLVKQCPDEVQRWGGAAMLRSLAGVEGILRLVEKRG